MKIADALLPRHVTDLLTSEKLSLPFLRHQQSHLMIYAVLKNRSTERTQSSWADFTKVIPIVSSLLLSLFIASLNRHISDSCLTAFSLQPWRGLEGSRPWAEEGRLRNSRVSNLCKPYAYSALLPPYNLAQQAVQLVSSSDSLVNSQSDISI